LLRHKVEVNYVDALRSYASDMIRPYDNYKTPCGKNEFVLLRRENLFLEHFARL